MNEIIKVGEQFQLNPQTNNQLVLLETQIKTLTEKRDAIRDLLMQEMKENGIYKMENDEISILYMSESERETFDSVEFKKEHRAIYDLYTRTNKVKESVRIRLKKEK